MAPVVRQRDRSENRRHLATLKAREGYLDHRLEAGRFTNDAMRDRWAGERNALRWAIAVAERWVAEGGVDDL